MKFVKLLSFLVLVMLLSVNDITAQITTDTLGTGTSSSATRGPFQRSDTASSSVYSRAQLMYTQAELATTLGIPSGASISQINWDLGSSNVITATGTATLNIYMKNSMVIDAVNNDTWANITTGSTLVGTYTFDATTNNFPGAKGLMDFVLTTPFVYTGNTIEVAVEWDCSGLTTTSTSPVNANKLFSGNGSLNWRWDATAHVSTLYRAGSSSAPTSLNKIKSERVNTQFVYTTGGTGSSDSATITFQINTANIVANGGTVSADGIYLAGGSGFGVPGDNPATDADGDGIWTVTVTRAKGFSSYYTFLNGNCPGWGCKEQLAGLPCSDPNNFDDRFFPAVYSDTTVLACFGSCESDGTCTPPATPSDITFNINMDSAPDSIKNTFTTVYVSGNFNGWSGDANPLTDNGDGTWTATVTIPATSDSIEYKFQVDNWAAGGDEQLTSGDPCTITDPSGAFVNRSLDVTGDEVLPVYCWSVCSSCLSGTNGLQVDNSLFTLNPSLVQNFTNITFSNDVVNQDKQVFVYNAVGSLVANTTVQNQSIYRLETADFANGLYFVTVKTGNTMLTQKFVVSK